MAEVIQKRLSIYDLFGYHPTEFQAEFHRFRRRQPYTTLVAHRRFGKTEANLIELLEGCLTCPKRLPIYQYLAPTLKQAKKIAWDKLKYYVNVARENGLTAVAVSESDAKIVFTHRGRSNPATIELCGWEEPESLRGPYTDGMVIDEAADMRAGVWGKILAPRLADRKGWSAITGTVKGMDQFFDFYRRGVAGDAKDPHWGSLYYPESLTHGRIPWLDDEALATLRSGMTETEWRQEMELDWNAVNDNVLILLDVITAAAKRQIRQEEMRNQPHILGVDVARFGDDESTLIRRRGPAAFPKQRYSRVSGTFLAAQVARIHREEALDAVMVDGTGGYGASVVDALRQMNVPFAVFEVQFNNRAMDSEHYYNHRSEMWDKMRHWLERGGAIPADEVLIRDLAAPQYEYDRGRLKLEDKREIRKRIGRSPDAGDALALTFAYPVYPVMAPEVGAYSGKFARSDFQLGI